LYSPRIYPAFLSYLQIFDNSHIKNEVFSGPGPGIIAWANRNEWPITPLKWQLNPRKTAAELFVEIREAAKMRDRLLITERSTKKEAR
jgi:hypothetical protein